MLTPKLVNFQQLAKAPALVPRTKPTKLNAVSRGYRYTTYFPPDRFSPLHPFPLARCQRCKRGKGARVERSFNRTVTTAPPSTIIMSDKRHAAFRHATQTGPVGQGGQGGGGGGGRTLVVGVEIKP